MIRAVFGSRDVITGQSEIPDTPLDIQLFPNPVSDLLAIRTDGFGIIRITVYDISGRLVMQSPENPEHLNVSGLSPGVYQLRIITDLGQDVTRKIIVHH
jgi:hypothetical protein